MVVAVLWAVAGLALLTVAADRLVLAAGRVAVQLQITRIVVGVVVIGLGTSAPELLVSGLAAGQGDTGPAVGNLAGSNILNLTLILGVTALIKPVRVASTVIRREAPLTLAATGLFAILAGIRLGPITGLILAAATIGALFGLIRLARTGADSQLPAEVSDYVGTPAGHRIGTDLVRTVAGLAGVLAGAQLLVTQATHIAALLGVSQVVIGFTVVAIGTSLPELVTAIQAQRRREIDLLVGNLLGSNMFNSLAGGAVVGLTATHPTSIAWPLLAAMLSTCLLAWALLFRGHTLTRTEGILLLAAYAFTLPLLV